MLSFITWDIDPEAFNLLGREVRWYGICWAIGVLCTSMVVQKIFQKEKHPEKWFDSLFLYVVIGLLVGARLGHCLAYSPEYYLSNPLEIFKVWEGGLASHGGAAGMALAVWIHSRRITKMGIIWSLDRLIVGIGIGAAFIRVGNLMNSEVYGAPTTLPWGFNFVRDRAWHMPLDMGGSGELPCHPTQIYEALIYLAIFGLTLYMFWKTNAKEKKGLILGVALIGIFLSRIFIEMIKNVQEPFEVQMRATYGLDMGQILSIPFVLWGIWLVWNALRKKDVTIINNKK
ncbi:MULTISPECIES: prolipoprotein diacylglyceryl transferase [unclassified Dysgonomonas]|uniref:prolipoprotein diacylglyceryl transferase n=1 Tax=unclassified Dysgonomonas TaxID=2630389 RepID=UPI0013ED2B5C|nr:MULTISPECIES: prolipoprotein diacylglyceryl transferase [unclassified Dysgonomonas]